MKTHPIGLDYLLPVWVARLAAGLASVAMLAAIYLLVDMLIWNPREWPHAVRVLFLGAVSAVIIQRSWSVIPRLRDGRLQERIRKFRAMRRESWEEMLDRLGADPEVEWVDEDRVATANPFGHRRRRSVVTIRNRDLLVEMFEAKGRVRDIRLRLIVED